MNDTVNEINTACINDAVEIVSRLKPIYTLKHARRQQEDLFLYGRGLPVLLIKNAIVNGRFDEDLYQELVSTLLQCIQRFQIIE